MIFSIVTPHSQLKKKELDKARLWWIIPNVKPGSSEVHYVPHIWFIYITPKMRSAQSMPVERINVASYCLGPNRNANTLTMAYCLIQNFLSVLYSQMSSTMGCLSPWGKETVYVNNVLVSLRFINYFSSSLFLKGGQEKRETRH